MDIHQLYKAITNSLGLIADENGLLSFPGKDGPTPALVDGVRLALPTPERLRSGAWSDLVAFHPLSEHTLRGESAVLKKVRTGVIFRLSAVLIELLQQLTVLGADSTRHSKLSPTAAKLLAEIKDVDAKTVSDLKTIIEKNFESGGGAQKFLSIYMKRGATLNGQKYARAAVVSFPFLDALKETTDRVVYGVQLRKKDVQALINLFLYILPDADDLEAYSVGSRSTDAPYFDALMGTFHKVGHRLNEVIRIHKKQLENEMLLTTELDWYPALKDLSVYRDVIPPLAGNMGEHGGDDAPNLQPMDPVRAVSAMERLADPAPTHSTSKPTSALGELLRPGQESKSGVFNTNLTLQTVLPAQPTAQDTSLFHNPAYAPPPAPAPTHHGKVVEDQYHVKHTERGLDVASLMEARNRVAQHAFVPFAAPAPAAPAGTFAGYHRGIPIQQNQWGAPGGYAPPGYGVAPGMGGYNPALPDWAQPGNGQVMGGGYPPAGGFGYGGYPPAAPPPAGGFGFGGPAFGQGVYPTMHVPPGGFR
jgi:hypothetical protein